MSSAKHDKKMEMRRQAKRRRRDYYASLAGTSTRAKRQTRKSTEPSGHKHEHLMANCGNAGCSRCNPRTSR